MDTTPANCKEALSWPGCARTLGSSRLCVQAAPSIPWATFAGQTIARQGKRKRVSLAIMPTTDVLIQDELGLRVPSVPGVQIVSGNGITFYRGRGRRLRALFFGAGRGYSDSIAGVAGQPVFRGDGGVYLCVRINRGVWGDRVGAGFATSK